MNCAGLIGRMTAGGRRLRDDADVVMFLLDEAGMAVVAGAAYGLSLFFRMSVATSLDVLQEGCARIASVVKIVQ